MDRGLIVSAALMLAAMSLIPLGDAAGKLLTTRHGVEPGFVAFARFAVGAAMVAAILGARVEWRLYRDGRLWLRAGLIAAGIGCILTALRTEEIATVFAAFFVGPLVSYVLSILLLGERVTQAQTLCLGLGFAGVLLVVRPGPGMGAGVGWALAAGCFYGGFLTASRWLAAVAPPRQLMLTQTAMGTLLLAPWGLAAAPASVDMAAGGLLLVSGVASASGNLLLVLAYRRTDATVLAPLVYLQLIAATGLGWAVFGTVPDAATAAGMAVLVAGGVGTLLLRAR
jgi:drug/metabolite transporter (DMT)-like permease